MIDFAVPEPILSQTEALRAVAEGVMRPASRRFDDDEHEVPWDYMRFMHRAVRSSGSGSMAGRGQRSGPRLGFQTLAFAIEMLSWGDAGLYLCTPGGGLGAAAVEATGTEEQKERFLARFRGEEPILACMAMTEPHCGSDTAAIRTRAVRDGDTWVLNGEKIFVTAGRKSLVDTAGFVVVWATLDPAAGRAGMRPFVIESGTPGLTVTKVEKKMGIRASDTASIVLQDCRIPLGNLLGDPEIAAQDGKGFRGAMATFDATRPLVSASALGVARAALEFLRQTLRESGVELRQGLPRSRMTNLEREITDMEILLRSSWLLVLKAAWLADEGRPNTLEASMAKVRAGEAVTRITQRAVELLGPPGYSKEWLLEKWMRDAKINDIFEGTGQINRLIVARRILGYSSAELS